MDLDPYCEMNSNVGGARTPLLCRGRPAGEASRAQYLAVGCRPGFRTPRRKDGRLRRAYSNSTREEQPWGALPVSSVRPSIPVELASRLAGRWGAIAFP
jgi:hypothetical protein